MDDPASLAESLYKQNKEITGKNKTLSILRKLYEISILTLGSQDLAVKISQTIQSNFGFDLVGVLRYDSSTGELKPLALESSEKLRKLDINSKSYATKSTLQVGQSAFLSHVISARDIGYAQDLGDVWGSLVGPATLKDIQSQSHIKSSVALPLIIQDEVIGILILSINRLYQDLGDFEKESIRNFVNVIAVALDKALLYEQLKVNNQQLKIMDQARAEFISIASHQLRTPPATIKWYLAAVISGDFGDLSPKVKEALIKAQLTNNGLITLIDDMLNASRIERGQMEFLYEETDVEPLIQQSVIDLTPQATMRKLFLDYSKPATEIPKILADREKLKQVISNLIDNAIKYTKQGGVTVKFESDGNNLLIKVTDTGKGLEPGEAATIFQKYGRGKDAKKHASGLGLGLYVAKIISEHHRGRVSAESPGPGKGTTFTVTLPIKTDLKAETFDLTQNQF
jgi:signal transduction histidine kinase